jgi:hypothetical protein
MTADASALPSPEDVAATFEQMRETVVAHEAKLVDDLAEAQEWVANAERELAEHRARYPMFFVEPEEKTTGRKTSAGVPDVETINKVLRVLYEHPNQTRKTLARRTGWSDSWLSRIILWANDHHGDVIAYGKHGRARQYFLTEAGRRPVDSGGVRD